MRFVSTSMKITSALVIFASATGLSYAGGYKGEVGYKGESVVAPCPQPCMLKDGFYVGAQVGYDSYRLRRSIEGVGPDVTSANPVLNATGWVGGLFVGYGQYMSDYFYLGAELFGNGSAADTGYQVTDAGVSYDFDAKARGSWGIAILPGVRLNDTSLGYIRLGWNWVRFKATEKITTAPTASFSESTTKNGFNFGVGIETLLVDNWSVRTEYTHTNYNNFTTDYPAKWRPSNNQFMLGLIYHFV